MPKKRPTSAPRPAPRPSPGTTRARSASARPTEHQRPVRKVRPAPGGSTWTTPSASPLRRAIERRSAVPLVFLHQTHRAALGLVIGAVLLLGLIVEGPVGFVALLLIALLVGWLSYLSAPRMNAGQRLLRVAGVAVIVAGAVGQLLR